jgi:uncharacterized membrane protein YgcG
LRSWRAVLGTAAVAVLGAVAVPVSPAMADGPGSTTIATGATIGASVVRLPDDNVGVALLGTGFPPGGAVRLLVRDLTGPATNIFYVTVAASSAPTTMCPGTTPCAVYPAGSILPPATVPLEIISYVNGVATAQEPVGCGDSLAASAGTVDGTVSSNVVILTAPSCGSSSGGGGGAGGGGGSGKPGPIHHQM